jgi:hypothetical protein
MILIDSNENPTFDLPISQCVPCNRVPLNVHNFADFFWYTFDKKTVQAEHKQIDEILAGLDHVEEQLSRQLPLVDFQYLLYSGTFVPVDAQHCQTLKMKGKVMVPGHEYKRNYSGVYAWFDQLDKCGVTVIQVASEEQIPTAIVTLFNSHQKVEHQTLKRYIKDKITIKSKDPQVQILLSIKGTRLKEEECERLVAEFGTCWNIFNQDWKQLEPICGEFSAKKLLKCIGR